MGVVPRKGHGLKGSYCRNEVLEKTVLKDSCYLSQV